MKETIQKKSMRKFIGLKKYMKLTSPKMIFKSSSIQHTLYPFLNQNTLRIDLPLFVNPSKHTLPYSTFQQINNCLLSSLKPPNFHLFLNYAITLTNTSSTIPSLDFLIDSNMVNIVRLGEDTSENGCLLCFIPSKICF